MGYPDFANDIEVYAFYSLLLGVALQIVSYVKYGEEKPPIDEGPVPMETEKRFVSPLGLKLAVVFVAVVILIGGVAILQFSGATSNVLPTLPHHATFTVGQGSYNILKEPDGSSIVILTISAFGGAAPYNFTASWSDGLNQTNTIGVFQRPFAAGLTIPGFVTVSVRSSDSQIAKVNVTIASK